MKTINKQKIIDIVKDTEYRLLEIFRKSNRTYILIEDIYGYKYRSYFVDFKREKYPLRFYKSNPYVISNIKLWLEYNKKNFNLLSNNYINNRLKLIWKCNIRDCLEEFEMNWDAIKSGQSCPYCSGRKVGKSNCLATKNPKLASEWHPTKNGDLTPNDVVCNSHKKVWWECEFGHEWKTQIASRSENSNCPYCVGRLPSKYYNLKIDNPTLCMEWNYDKNSKSPKEFTPKSRVKVWWKCLDCNHEWMDYISSRNVGKCRCPECRLSYGEKTVKSILNKLNIHYIQQYMIKNNNLNKRLYFDFYLPNKKMFIEIQGQHHYKPTRYGGISKEKAIKNLEIQKKNDDFKRKYCKENNIKLLEISYLDFDKIEEIITKELIENYK